jgi:hypothetical protein
MAGIKFDTFIGEIPYLHKYKLPNSAASSAVNVRLDSGVLAPLTVPTVIKSTSLTNPESIFYYKPNDGTDQWLEFPNPTDVVTWPLGTDDHDRIIYSSAGFSLGPRIASSAQIGSNAGAPDSYAELNVPPPDGAPVATVSGIT